MNTTQSDGVILKTDVLGRVKMPATRREVLLDEFERSGMSGVAFAEFVGIKYQTFATWAQQRRRKRKPSTQPKSSIQTDGVKSVRLLEAVIDRAQPTIAVDQTKSPLVLHLPCGARVEMVDAKQVTLAAALLNALAKSC